MAYSKLNLCLFFLLPLLILQTIVVGEPQVPCFFIFGDSMVDNGNNLHRQTIAKANYLPYGIDFSEGPTGRNTNGRTIADIIAKMLNFEKYIPPFANITNQDILRGVNYASGGAGVFDETAHKQLGDVISFNEQLSNHEVIVSHIAKLLGSETAAKEYLNKCIYLVEMCTNDYYFWYFYESYSTITEYTPQELAEIVIIQYSKQLQRLYNNGARKVAVSELHNFSTLPVVLTTYSFPERGDSAIQNFNENLKLLISDLNNQLPDAKFLYTKDTTAASYGNFKVTNESCCATIKGSCVRGSVPCSNRDEYLFWDGYHPTDAANMIFGKIAYDNMSPLYLDSVDVW